MQNFLHVLFHEAAHEMHHIARIVPFLFLAYFIIEYIEKYSSEKLQKLMTGFGKFGPLGGAVLGCVPQCGFSAAAANFYSTRVITPGTLVAVFIATTDEAVPLLFSNFEHRGVILRLLAIKILIGALVGFILDFSSKSAPDLAKSRIHIKHAHCCDEEKGIVDLVVAAAKHTFGTLVFIFIISVALGVLIEAVGEDNISAFFMGDSFFQPLMTALIGFIPNCASSVFITELYIEGTISFGSAIAGLCTGAGIGLAVLLKENRPAKDNFRIVGVIYVASVIAGLIF